jgi:hypothetical protein
MPVKKEKEVYVILGEEDRQVFDATRRAVPGPLPSHGSIAKRAFELYLARGGSHGRDMEDWLQAERELGLPRG